MKADNWKSRTELLVGSQGIAKLHKAHVLVAGLGGVGGYAAEQLCRAGIGRLTIADSDTVQSSNINRQIIALKSTIHQKKTEVFRQRLLDINSEIRLTVNFNYLLDDSIDELLAVNYDYIVDAIDTLTPKVQLLARAKLRNLPIISSMGAGGKFDPSMVAIADISESHHCKFASVVRSNLRKLNIHEGIKVVFSPETVSKSAVVETKDEKHKRSVVGTISYMPPIFGCFCASVVITDILGI